MKLDLDQLEKLADAATPGPWVYSEKWTTIGLLNSEHYAECGWDNTIAEFDCGSYGSGHDTNRYIAAMHPGTAKVLIGEVRRLRAKLSTCANCDKTDCEVWGPFCSSSCAC